MSELKCAKCGKPLPGRIRQAKKRDYCVVCYRQLRKWLNWMSYKIKTYEIAYNGYYFEELY